MENVKAQPRKHAGLIQFIKFGLVGASNTAISFIIYALVLIVFSSGFGIPEENMVAYFSASIISWLISVLNSYFWSNRFVFKQKEGEQRVWWKTLIKTYISYATTGLILANILLFVWNDVVHIGQYLGWLVDIVNKLGIDRDAEAIGAYCSTILNLIITIPLNFVINKFWAYKDKKTKKVEEKAEIAKDNGDK